jgi:hypothetical protein
MEDRLEKKGRGGSLIPLLILIGFFLFAGSLLGPAVKDFLPADGFTIWSTQESFFRIVRGGETSVDYQLVFMLIGAVLLFAGIILRRRGR